MDQSLRDKIAHLPTEPGVYLMKDHQGEIIYVGKAVNLRNRVRSYFGGGDERAFVALLDDVLGDLQVIVVGTEKEALLLENELIKKYRPRFNVDLRDDKSFIALRIDEKEAWPRIELLRSHAPRPTTPERGVRMFGPYSSATSIRETLRLIYRYFHLRSCTDHQFEQCKKRNRPCLQYQIGRCPGPCVGAIDPETYRANVRDVILFLEGKETAIVERLQDRMKACVASLAFEEAAQARDQLQAIERSLEKQRMISYDRIDRDVLGFFREADRLMLYMLYIRAGRLNGGRTFPFKGQEFPTEELLASFAMLYYGQENPIPDELLLPLELEDAGALEELLSERREKRVRVLTPKRGAKSELVEMARRNAENAFQESRRSNEELLAVLTRLQKSLDLSKLPRTIECYDISLFQGSSAVGSKVRFKDGEPDKAGYRHFRIKTVEGTDDFAMLYEVLTRRVKQGDLPDLFLIDGGKGQLASAAAALRDLGVTTEIASLAKSRILETGAKAGRSVSPDHSPERVFVLGRKDPIILKQNSPELFILTRLRDESHRFAITYHRVLRSKRAFASGLDEIPGVGETRRKALLRHFGSIKKLGEAPVEAIAEVEGIGESLARVIHEAMGRKKR